MARTNDGRVKPVADPLPVTTAVSGARLPHAETLARSIRSDPTSRPPLRCRRDRGLELGCDAAPGASVCDWRGAPLVVTLTGDDPAWTSVALVGGHRISLYLLDLPEGLSARTLAIAIVAPGGAFRARSDAAFGGHLRVSIT